MGKLAHRRIAAPCALLLIATLVAPPYRASTQDVDLDGDGVSESTVILTVLETWPPKVQNRVINNGGDDQTFNWLNAGPGGFRSRANASGETRWTWQTAQTVYAYTGTTCRNDMCTFRRDGTRLAGAFGVPGRTVVVGSNTTSTAALTSSLVQSFSPGQTLLSCTSSVELLANGNFAYSITCLNDTGATVKFEVAPEPLGCCEAENQLRCDQPTVVVGDDPDDSTVVLESVCLDYLVDPDNCGACGAECLDGEVCSDGQCLSLCPEGTTWCGAPHDPDDAAGFCADLANDADNCGACGTICPSRTYASGRVDGYCDAGQCALCPNGARTRCGDACVNLFSDIENCGACGRDCGDECEFGGTCDRGQSCLCDDTSAKVGRESRVSFERGEHRAATRALRVAKDLAVGVEPPAPVCENAGQSIVVPDGESIRECFASPNLPVEVQGSLRACGGLIPAGSPLCDGALGTEGIFQQFEPGMLLPGPVALSIVRVGVLDGTTGNRLIEPGEQVCLTVEMTTAGFDGLTGLSAVLSSPPIDLDCGVISTIDCEPENGNPAAVTILQGETPYPDLGGIVQSDPDNTSCFDANGDPLPRADLLPGVNLVPLCFFVPADHPADVVRPFELLWSGFDGNGMPFQQAVPFALGISASCDLGTGDLPDGVVGFADPLAQLVPAEDPLPFPAETVTGGTVLDLQLELGCGGANVTDADVDFAPRIVRIEGASSGDVTPADGLFEFDPSVGRWRFSLSTGDLAPDSYEVTVRLGDVKDYHSGFQLCDDSDGDGVNDCSDRCEADPGKTEPGICGCGVSDADGDGDGTVDCDDACPDDPAKLEAGVCGCGVSDADGDGDGTADCDDACPEDPAKFEAGVCGCGVSDADGDGDGTADCDDACPEDPAKLEAGVCGCGVSDADGDGDGTADCDDACPEDPAKLEAGACGCGVSDADRDGDGTADCDDACPEDPAKLEAGICGCGVSDADSDGDGTEDCNDGCAADPAKTEPGICGCGVWDADGDGDGTANCNDECAFDAAKIEPGICGCGVSDADADGDGTADCHDECGSDPGKIEPGICGCGVSDADGDGDGTPDCNDRCPADPAKTEPGSCGCGAVESDADGDGTPNCIDQCPEDPAKVDAGFCDCGTPETDEDDDGTPDCMERCGNGMRDPGEQCDDGNNRNHDHCRNNCTLARRDDGDDDDDDESMNQYN